ncbi:hypothetical protein [uncultured Microbacterium sp.]|uniref:hypothetical protein n=1 Tax=uncultured Microbacterium sp. TaxID=191216 RepID=UPI0025DFBF53|nr:hypothetical protein [uncultured Microbacterium sp.]
MADNNDSGSIFGVVVANTSASALLDVRIQTRLKNAPQVAPIWLRILPPGTHLVRRANPGSMCAWEFARELLPTDKPFQPIVNSIEYRVIEIAFIDNRNQRWTTDERAILTRGGSQ